MAEVRLGAVRIGFPYSIEVQVPVGFLEASQSLRMKLRRYAGDPAPIELTSEKLDGQSVQLSLTAAQTVDMLPGTYVGEAIVYDTLDAGVPEIPLTNNRYLAECDYSPSE